MVFGLAEFYKKPSRKISRTVNLSFPYTEKVFLILRRGVSLESQKTQISGIQYMQVFKCLQKRSSILI